MDANNYQYQTETVYLAKKSDVDSLQNRLSSVPGTLFDDGYYDYITASVYYSNNMYGSMNSMQIAYSGTAYIRLSPDTIDVSILLDICSPGTTESISMIKFYCSALLFYQQYFGQAYNFKIFCTALTDTSLSQSSIIRGTPDQVTCSGGEIRISSASGGFYVNYTKENNYKMHISFSTSRIN